jgi:hypothetical protein
MTTRVFVLLTLGLFIQPVLAQVCELSESTDSSIDGRNFQIKIPGDATITIIQGRDLKDEVREGAADLFIERSLSGEELATRVNQFLSVNQDNFSIAESNLNFLQNRLQSQHPPAFVAVDMSSEELAYLRKVATTLSLHQYAQVNALGAKNAHWDKLLLITVGPVVYLRARKPELFHATTLMAMDDQALNPFDEALNWEGQKTPEWMEKVVGSSIKDTDDLNSGSLGKLPEGDGVFVLSVGLSPVTSSAFVSACEKLHRSPSPGPPPSKTEQGNIVPTAREEELAAAEDQSRSRFHGGSRPMEIYRATKETDPEVARKNAMARHARAYSWVTTDGAGHRWVHIRPIHYNQKERSIHYSQKE